MTASATSRQEVPLWFDVDDEKLFGVHTVAGEPSRGIGVIIAAGGGTPLSTNVNDLSVRLMRRLAADGFDGFRFDYRGVGESTGTLDRFHLAEPFAPDMVAAAECLRRRGVERFVLIGSCFGARTALAAAPQIGGVVQVILVAPPVRDFEMGERIATRMAERSRWSEYLRKAVKPQTLRNLTSRRARRAYFRLAKEKFRYVFTARKAPTDEQQARYGISPRFLDPLRSLVVSGVATSFIFGEEDDLLNDFERARAGPLGEVLNSARGGVDFHTVPGEVHGFTSVSSQQHVFDAIIDQLSQTAVG
ncbi:MAG: alpha/beta fold hydrolase [Acidimicrobiia bacterium]|nr:alpha/beta fold hydrolase [Acidimicrobiia bacterium]